MQEALLTIITPTYNRAHTLSACYESLCFQTDKRFIWLIVDDGSRDNTEDLVKNWIAENNLSIIYKKKENGGKASALNVGLNMLDTPYAVCLDSDDIFYPDAVRCALSILKEKANDEKCCGILALRNSPDGNVMGGKPIPSDYDRITAVDIYIKFNSKTELICFYKAGILKQFRFPEFPGEKFVPPSWMHYEITRNYYFVPSREQFCRCEYMEDGLTKNKRKIIINNPQGYTYVQRYGFDFAPNLRMRIKYGIMYDVGCLLGNDKNWLKNVRHKVLASVLMPVAWIVKKQRFKI